MSIFKTSSGRWGARIDLHRGSNGKRVQKKLGSYRTQKEALKAERDALDALERGIDLAPATVTVTELVTRYVDNRVVLGRGIKTVEEYRSLRRLYIDPHIGTVKIPKLTKAMVSGWIGILAQSGGSRGIALGPKTVKHAYGLLSAALTWGMKLDIVTRNVCVAVDPPTVPKSDVSALSSAETDDISNLAEDSRWGYFIAISMLLGSRRGETLALNRPDIDFERAEATFSKSMSQVSQIKGGVFVKPTKTDRVRVLGMPEAVQSAFRKQFAQQAADRLLAGEKYVVDPARPIFTDEMGNRLSPKAATNAYARLAKKAGLSSTRLHSARHTTATLLIRLGVDIITVAAILGHANANVTLGVYGHLVPGAKRQGLEALANHVGSERKRNRAEN